MSSKKRERAARLLHALLAAPARWLLRVRVYGRENIPAEEGCVVAVNHIAFLDPIVLSAAFPRRRMPKYLAKAELFRIPILRGLIRLFGAIPLDRGGGDAFAVRRAVAVAKEGELLSVFPQGTRCGGKNPADTPIRSGAGMIAARAEVPILPVCIRTRRMRYAPLRRVEVLIGKPLSPGELGLLENPKGYRAASERAFLSVCTLGGFVPTLPDKEKGA